MTLYAIVLTEASDEVDTRIKEKYTTDRELYDRLSDTFYLVRSDSIYSEDIAVEAGIKGDDRIEGVSGAVFKLNGAYAGYASKSLWEWLRIEE